MRILNTHCLKHMLDYRWSVEFTDVHSSQVRLVGQSQSSLIHCYDTQSHRFWRVTIMYSMACNMGTWLSC